MTTFCAISDTHGLHDKIEVPLADIVFHAGDCTNTGTTRQIREFVEWYGKLPHKHKILIAGNHDWNFEKAPERHRKICEDNGVIYLQDESVIVGGIKIHGSPQTPEFCNWAFNCWRSPQELALDKIDPYPKNYDFIGKYWDMIDSDVDILMTHGPAYEILDYCYGKFVGCELLREKIKEVAPQYHISGHIHSSVGDILFAKTHHINAACLGEDYRPNGEEIKIFNIEGTHG